MCSATPSPPLSLIGGGGAGGKLGDGRGLGEK